MSSLLLCHLLSHELGPGQLPSLQVCHKVEKGDNLIFSGRCFTPLIGGTGELHVVEPLITLLLLFADMLQCLIIPEPDGRRIVNQKYLRILRPSSNHYVLRPEPTMQEVFEVVVLQDRYQFDAH